MIGRRLRVNEQVPGPRELEDGSLDVARLYPESNANVTAEMFVVLGPLLLVVAQIVRESMAGEWVAPGWNHDADDEPSIEPSALSDQP